MSLKPLWPLVRRLRALRALGISMATICTETGLDSFQVEMVLDFTYAETTPEVDRVIRQMYERHESDEYAPSEQDKLLIWPVPYDWSDIDDILEHALPSRYAQDFSGARGAVHLGDDGIWRNALGWAFCNRGHYYYPWNVRNKGGANKFYCEACWQGRVASRYSKNDVEYLIAEEYRRLERQSHVQSA